MRTHRKSALEVALVVVVYSLFLAVGVYSGQTTINVDIITPPEAALLHSSPVELIARVTIRGVPESDLRTRFAIMCWGQGETSVETSTDTEGIARLLIPASSGNYTWHVTAMKGGYPQITSRSSSFSIRLSLVVEPLMPSATRLATSPVDFKARVKDINGRSVDSANVTFYVDSMNIGSSLTGTNGMANLSRPLVSGTHTWFASGNKDDEGGISEPTVFVVGEIASLQGEDSQSFESNVSPLGQQQSLNIRESVSHGLHATVTDPVMMVNLQAAGQAVRIEKVHDARRLAPSAISASLPYR